MAQSRCIDSQDRGFTIVEVLVASVILVIGLVSVAGVIGGVLGGTSRSGYMNQAATLATEKLEDLNRYPSADPNVIVPNNISAGSLTSDIVSSGIPYYDEVYFSPSAGAMEETIEGLDTNGNVQYTTTTYTPGGQITASAPSSSAPSSSGELFFKRRWIIEQDQPLTGVRRLTVLVSLQNQNVQPPVNFQMSLVRP
jgi:prepilin-type N-terminal cleavage/methylation domain-containing protein